MGISRISNVEGLIHFVSENSTWSPVTVENAASALGYRKSGGLEGLKRLSSWLVECAKHGVSCRPRTSARQLAYRVSSVPPAHWTAAKPLSRFCGIQGFTMYDETVKFFQENRRDITRNLELAAKIIGKDTALMIQGFGIYRGQCPPSCADIYRALDTARIHADLTDLYNVFSWFCLEDISSIWYRYLDNNYPFYASLTA
jgi:hypothetical protein